MGLTIYIRNAQDIKTPGHMQESCVGTMFWNPKPFFDVLLSHTVKNQKIRVGQVMDSEAKLPGWKAITGVYRQLKLIPDQSRIYVT